MPEWISSLVGEGIVVVALFLSYLAYLAHLDSRRPPE